MRRNRHQRKAYALARLSRAVDRSILAKSSQAKEQAQKWAAAWAKAAGLNPT
jgi:hypothetical protein